MVDISTFTKNLLNTKVDDILGREKDVSTICTATHPSLIKPLNKGGHSITFSFESSVRPLFESMTGLRLRQSRPNNGIYYWYCELDEKGLAVATAWHNSMKPAVFIKSSLDCTVALSRNFLTKQDLENGNYTEIGALEHAAKELGDETATAALIAHATKFIQTKPIYSPATFIAAIPHSTPKPKSLSEKIAEGLATNLGKKCLVDTMSWANKHQSLQETGTVAEKQRQLESFDFTFTPPNGFDGATVILVDDLYQSGSTMEYVAAQLKHRGASKVMGLAMVKSLSNTANTVSKK